MKQALIDYDVRLDDVPIMCDNKGAIDLSKNSVQHSRTKHIEIRHHFLRDNVQKGHISIEKLSWSLDELAYGVPLEGPYQTNPPSPDDIISFIRTDREGQVTRICHEQEIDVQDFQILTREIVSTLKPLEEIIWENVFCLGGSGYQQKDRKPSQNDKTEHGMEKTVKNQGQRPKKSKSKSIQKNQQSNRSRN
ncbi:hypothetical protein Tco_0243150 [Tanacetum coccineum]